MLNRIQNMIALIPAQDNKLFMDVINSIPEWCNDLDNNFTTVSKTRQSSHWLQREQDWSHRTLWPALAKGLQYLTSCFPVQRGMRAISYLTVPLCSEATLRKHLLKKAQEAPMGPRGPDLGTELTHAFQVPAKAVSAQVSCSVIGGFVDGSTQRTCHPRSTGAWSGVCWP